MAEDKKPTPKEFAEGLTSGKSAKVMDRTGSEGVMTFDSKTGKFFVDGKPVSDGQAAAYIGNSVKGEPGDRSK